VGTFTKRQRRLGYYTPWEYGLFELRGRDAGYVATKGSSADFREAFRMRKTRRKFRKAALRVIRRLRREEFQGALAARNEQGE
jgi:hypothetical protein